MRERKLLSPTNFDALPLEYKRRNRAARGNLDVTNLINNPAASGVCRVFGLSLPKEGFDIGLAKFSALLDNRSDAVLVTEDAI